jgi:hypothetical protein
MKPLPVLLLSAMLLSAPAGARPVYKCQERGVTTYTDQPCPGDAAPADLPPLVVTAPPGRDTLDAARRHDQRQAAERAERDRADGEWLKRHRDRRDREARVRKAIVEHRVIRGMTRDEVRQALGEPERIDSGDSYGTDKETWTYVLDGERRTVNFKDGEVTTTARRGRRER